MSRYDYVARDLNGAIINGIMEADDDRDVRGRLKQRGFYATSITAVRERRSLGQRRKIRSEEIAVLAEQLAVMIDSGLPLPRCLTALARQNKSERLKQIIDELRQDIENGAAFADSLAKHPEAFSDLFVGLVRSGEVGGVLGKVLHQLSNYLDKEQQTKQAVKSAFVYPKIAITLCIATAIFVSSFVIPRFAAVYDQLGLDLPIPTLILIASSNLILNFWWAMLIGAGALVFAYKKFSVSRVGREVLDRVKLRLPVFGDLNRKAIVARFVRVFGALNLSGVPIMQSLEVIDQVVNNVVIQKIIDDMSANVRAGGRIGQSLANNDIFPPMVVQMIEMGEETGRLGESLEISAGYLERELDTTIKRLVVKLEPALTIAVAAVVGLIAMGIYLPMFDIIKGASSL